jgi:glycosyltransferase involved in cell wall biosynthesis
MTVVFLPDYTRGNPYQSNLAAALDEEVAIGSGGRLLPILGAVRSHEDVSAVHFHWLHPYIFTDSILMTIALLPLTILQLMVLRVQGTPIVWTVHNVMSHGSRYPRLERWFKHAFVRFGFCSAIFVHCESVAETLIEEFRLPETIRQRVTVVPHGHYLDNYENAISKTEARSELGLERAGPVFLYLGQISPYKGVPTLIDEFKTLEDPDARLLVVGKPTSKTLERTVRDTSADDERIDTVLSFVPDNEIQRYMNAADCVVLPYNEITTSGSAILAMSFGKAIVIPRLGCVPELLDEQGSLMYRHDDGDGLRRALTEATQRDLRAMGAHNAQLVRRYDWDDIAQTTSRVYAGLH